MPRRPRAAEQAPSGPGRSPPALPPGSCCEAEVTLPQSRACQGGDAPQTQGWASGGFRMGGWSCRQRNAEPGAPLGPLSLRPSRPQRCAQRCRHRSGTRHWALQRFSGLSSLVIPALPEPATASSFLALAIMFSPSCIGESTTPAARARPHV